MFTDAERRQLADYLTSLTATADLLGRYQVRQKQRQAERQAGVVREGHEPGHLPVPHKRQTTSYSCGAACFASVAELHGATPDTEDAAIRALGTSPRDGTPPDAIADLARERGLAVQIGRELTMDDLANAVGMGAPVIVAIQAYGTPTQVLNAESGHYVVVCGVTPESVRVMDPSSENAYDDIPTAEFQRVWFDKEADGSDSIRLGIAIGSGQVQESARLREATVENVTPMPPQEAINYFQALEPRLGIDPIRYGAFLERQAFTMAVATEKGLLDKVQSFLRDKLASGQGFTGAGREIEALLDAAGVTGRNPQYSEMLFRTNTLDAMNAGAYREMRDPDVADSFPVWRYENPDDSRSRPEHAKRNGKFYPADVPFIEVRGTDIGEAANCRCTFTPIFKAQWRRMKASGASIADGYADVPD